MKLNELMSEDALDVRAESALRSMDWDFDIDATDEYRLRKGGRQLAEAEALIGALLLVRPERAKALWETYCPYACAGSLPASARR